MSMEESFLTQTRTETLTHAQDRSTADECKGTQRGEYSGIVPQECGVTLSKCNTYGQANLVASHRMDAAFLEFPSNVMITRDQLS